MYFQIRKLKSAKSGSSINDVLTLLNAPKLEIEHFTGDLLDHSVFISMFNESVGKMNLSAESKLTRLIQSTSGEAKMATKNCALLGGQVGYDQALALLKKRFGNSNLIARSVIDYLISSKNVSRKDLAQLADCISIAHTTLKKLSMLLEIDTQGSILSILQRCPHFVKAARRRKNKGANTSTCILCYNENHKLYQCGIFKDMKSKSNSLFMRKGHWPTLQI